MTHHSSGLVEMLKLIVFCFVMAAVVLITTGQDKMLGPGKWFVINIELCPNDELYEHRFNIQRFKMNRTHDAFTADMNLTKEINEDYGIRIDLCKQVDGGCKPYQVLSDDCFVNFLNKYAKSNVEKALTMAEVDPPEFPLSPGYYLIKNYMFDYCELPSDGVYGMFEAKGFILKGETEVGCVHFTVEFRDVDAKCGEPDDEEEEC